MTQRLHHIREHTFRLRIAEWRRMSEDKGERPPAFLAADMGEELLYEIVMLRAELAGAEERGADRELAAAVSFLRTTSAYWTLGDTPWGAAARRLERCDHRTGAAENE
jgi:hypothetical protein